jgi:hypothetical protein
MSEANKPAFAIAFVLVAQLIFIGILLFINWNMLIFVYDNQCFAF